MIKLQGDARLIIKPRWPYNAVFLSERAYAALLAAQTKLEAQEIRLILTRGYENQGPILKLAHALARLLGAAVFGCLCAARKHEAREIFSPNGHDQGGDCVDVGIDYQGKELALLPLGVFTPAKTIDYNRRVNQFALKAVYQALNEAGFEIHANQTEALQIHCALKESDRHAI